MKINTECPECNAEIEIDISKKKHSIKCPKCGKTININIDDKNNSITEIDDLINNLGN